MHQDEKDIINYLKGWTGSFVSGKEIARKVGGRDRYEDDRGWALPILVQMVRTGQIETDHLGYYRLMPERNKKKGGNKQFVSPQVLRLLKQSGKNFESIVIDADEDSPEPA